MLITTINSMENDLVSAKSDTKLLREEAEKMNKEKGQICAQILAKERKIASLESDSSTLNQTMEHIQEERVSSSKKLSEKRACYTQVAEDIKLKPKQKQVKGISDEQMAETEGKCGIDNNNFMDNKRSEVRETLMANLVSVEYKLDEIAQKTLKLVQENKKPEMLAMDIETLEEEHAALLSNKDGESKFWECLKDQIEQVKWGFVAHGCGTQLRLGKFLPSSY
ncbi:uncharacterized protein LOC116141116 [Pistacia vera]|uniref:uncharacterized protein LOC116141116 n=1 Tax=Pistacia vera TaxID=55513 RepID=UPI00126357BD|nr:uncharacterized protein LOC116141116 [Pistacia vera]